MLIYSRHIVVVHLVFSLSENPFIWSELRLKLRPFLAFKGLLNRVLCALLLQSGKAVDFKSYADLILTYCSCAPRIQFVRKSIYLVKIEVSYRTINKVHTHQFSISAALFPIHSFRKVVHLLVHQHTPWFRPPPPVMSDEHASSTTFCVR